MEETENVKKAVKRKRRKAKNMEKGQGKSKEQILAERQAKKAAKKQGKEPVPSLPMSPKEPASPAVLTTTNDQVQSEKSREQVKAEREAKKLAKQAGKKPQGDGQGNKAPQIQNVSGSRTETDNMTRNRTDPIASNELHGNNPIRHKSETGNPNSNKAQLAKSAQNKPPSPKKSQAVTSTTKSTQSDYKVHHEVAKTNSDRELAQKMESLHISDVEADKKSKPTTKAERRAMQEAQRAAKAKQQQEKLEKQAAAQKKPKVNEHQAAVKEVDVKTQKSPPLAVPQQKSSALHKVRLFKHLYTEKCDLRIKANSRMHPAIVKLGAQYGNDTIVGSNARCYAFLNAMKTLITDFVTPPEKVFSRALESEIQIAVEFLQKCRPMAVSMTNALKYIKVLISREDSNESDEDKKQIIIEKIDTYAHEQIEKAAESISLKVREKISDDDVILTYGCSSLIKRSLIEAWKDNKKFSVVVVDSRPDHEGQGMLKSLTMEGISCTYVLINAISFIMPKVTKVLLGAHALLANGYVMSRVGTAQISMIANSYNVPVLVCCETHKFSERVQTDSFVYNEIGDPNALVKNKNSKGVFEHLKDWESIPHLTPLNLRYDITPPELVTVVVTEVALLPCTSVQVILRVKPSEFI